MAAQTGATNIVQLPLAFVRSGNVYIDYGRLVSTGYVGDYWSRTANSATTGRDLIFHTTYVNPSLLAVVARTFRRIANGASNTASSSPPARASAHA